MENRSQKIQQVAISGMIGNIFLLVIKLIAGFTFQSNAMIADGLNSAGDVFSSVMTYIGNHISSKPSDHDHPYGHGKAEYIFSMIISFSLLLVSFGIIRSSVDAFHNENNIIFDVVLVIVALITIVIKTILYFYAKHIGKKHNSLLAMANASDHRNDVLIGFLTLSSILTGYFDLYFIDAIAGIIIALFIAFSAFEIFSSAYNVLMDTTLDEDIKKELFKEILTVHGVDHVDEITSKPIGLKFLLIVKVSVDGSMTIIEGHRISAEVKHTLMCHRSIDDVIVHLNSTQEHPHSIQIL